MIFKRLLIIGALLVLSVPAKAGTQEEQDCASYAQAQRHIGWQDICYTADDNPQPVTYTPDRSVTVTSALDSFERAGSRAKVRTDELMDMAYPGYNEEPRDRYVTYQEAAREEKQDRESTEEWLKREYPYFYKEHMEKMASDRDYRSLQEEYEETFEDGVHSNVPPFLKYLDYGLIVESQRKPTYYLDAVFPIIQTEDQVHTIFNQDRFSKHNRGGRNYSVGFGYRYYDARLPAIAGANMFYDFQNSMEHFRLGYGLELMTEHLEGRANVYNALSSQRSLGIGAVDIATLSRVVEREIAVDGYDWELGLTVPGMSMAKVFGGMEKYFHSFSQDEKSWTTRLELKPMPFTTLNLKYINQDDDKDARLRFDGRVNFDFSSFDPKDMMHDLLVTHNKPLQVDFKERLLDRVERNFEIKVETFLGKEALPNLVGNLANVRLVVRFPGSGNCVTGGGSGDDNGDGVVQAGDEFEIDFELTNNSSETSTDIAYSQATTSQGWTFGCNDGADLGDAGPGEVVITDEDTDMDLAIPDGTSDGTSFTITLHFTADGEEIDLTFGTLVVGDIHYGDSYNVLSFH